MDLDIVRLEADVRRRLADRPGLVAVLLFGSHAVGRSGPLSDVDIAVLAAPDLDRRTQEELYLFAARELSDMLPDYEVDVVQLNHAPHPLQYRIFRDGILLLCLDRNAYVQFKAQAVSMYLDFKPALDYREARILERARRGELTSGPNPHRRAYEHHRRQRGRAPTDAGDVG